MSTAKQFKDSQEAAYRRMVRATIRKADLTKSERDVILALVNHWFHHRTATKNCIHPGRQKLAKTAGVTVKTVSRTLAMLRAAGAIEPLNGVTGGGKIPTKYAVHIHPLMTLCGADWIDEFLRGYYQNVPLSDPKMSHCRRDKMSHSIELRRSPPSQKVKTEVRNA